MAKGDAVFAADGAHIGELDGIDGEWLTVRGDGHTYRVLRTEVAAEHDGRIFLTAANRAAAHIRRVDVGGAGGLRGWWERGVLGPSSRHLGGRLDD